MEENEEIEEKKIDKRKVSIFITRLLVYIIFGAVIPLSFLIWKFKLFSSTKTIRIGGWGVVAIILLAFFLSKLIKQATDCIEEVLYKQILNGVRTVFIPLLTITLCIYSVNEFWQQLMSFLIVLTVCEPIAYIVNPIPEYIKDSEDKKKKNKLISILEIFWERKDK